MDNISIKIHLKMRQFEIILLTLIILLNPYKVISTCTTYNSAFASALSVPPSGTEGVTETSFTSTLVGVVESIKIVNLVGSHDYLSDLEFSLISPQGTKVLILTFDCGDSDSFSLKLQDDTDSNMPCPVNTGQYYNPSNPFSQFISETSEGLWTLSVEDTAEDDSGTLASWGLEICTGVPKEYKKVLIKEAPMDTFIGYHFILNIVNFTSSQMKTSEGNLSIDNSTKFIYEHHEGSLYIDNSLGYRSKYKSYAINPNKTNEKGKAYVAWDITLDSNYCNCSASNKVGNGIVKAFIKFFHSDKQAEIFYDYMKIKTNNSGIILKTSKNLEMSLLGSTSFVNTSELEGKFFDAVPAKSFCSSACSELR